MVLVITIVLALTVPVERGQAIYETTAGCGACHMIGGRGGLLGPDLSNIGAERSLHDLREVLTSPRALIPRGFQPVRITTLSGEAIEGVVKNEDSATLQ